jgi:hypothetical protein
MTAMELVNAKIIRKGEKFECIQDVVMDNDELAYKKGEVYISDTNGCITDRMENIEHSWEDGFGVKCEDWQKYFKRI